MLRLFKTWLILLLITTVPLQAAAAGATRLCAPFAASPAAMKTAACQHHAARSSAVADSASTPEDNETPAQHPACGACAGFCLGALMPPSLALPAAACTGAQQVTIATATLLAGFIPDGPRRPPRPLSA
ncbi:hypothetical protein [Janthinobacterium lividum]|uniref:DUF2946 domain-containing protein n=1 Tax=Janthinobacterium lividum TaxID=29581 RepID=A0ABU0XN96_9BURK|nr:hypothetical protein [Janthinobacterium lividum]MDQ4624995.1 hypothetical protein [Janthinobacterium lividum]MDQ4673402.1 hypothetical protein [Janthinobacterium lividum]MDQ4684132.1 hypothetical protein [Janthinobacterium lividum]